MSGHLQDYPSAYNIKHNTWLTYGKPPDGKMYLFMLPVSTMKKLGIKKPIDVVAHWVLCINGFCYELQAMTKRGILRKKKTYGFGTKIEPEFVEHRHDQRRPIVYGELGYMAGPYPDALIREVGNLVWERSLKKKYAFDEYNCQVFIRLLVELIGDRNVKVRFPQFLDHWVRGAGNTRDGSFYAFAAGASVLGASMALLGMDAGMDADPSAAEAFGMGGNTTLRSATSLLTERYNRKKKIKDGQKDIRKEMKKRGRPLLPA